MSHPLAHIEITKFPSTPHIAGSALQPGDSTHGQVCLKSLAARYPEAVAVLEEKIDGANCGTSFSPDLTLLLQSRGHVLAGGAREAQFNLFKEWGARHEAHLMEALEDRYIVYSDWCFSCHTMYYDQLPHYLMSFDVFDRQTGIYLDRAGRAGIIARAGMQIAPEILSVPVKDLPDPAGLLGLSAFRSLDWRTNLREARLRAGVDPDAGPQMADDDRAEGIYVKIEQDGRVIDRLKYVRPGFRQAISRSPVRNALAPGIDIMAEPAANNGPEF